MKFYDRFFYMAFIFCIIISLILPSEGVKLGLYLKGDYFIILPIFLYGLKLVLDKDSRSKLKNYIFSLKHNKFDLALLLLMVLMIVSITYAANKVEAVKSITRFATYFSTYFIIKCEFDDYNKIQGILRLVIIVFAITSLVGIIQYFFPGFLGANWMRISAEGRRVRVSSIFENPNNLGAFLVITIFPIIMLTIKEKYIKKKIIYGVISVLGICNIILTDSRNAQLALVIGMSVIILFYSYKFILAFFVLGIGVSFIPMIHNRLLGFTDYAQNESRIKIWKAAIMMIKDHPIRGIGQYNFPVLYRQYVLKNPKELEYFYGKRVFHPHNIFLKFCTELGLIGLIVLIICMILLFNSLISFIKKCKDENLTTFYKGFTVSLIGFLAMNCIDYFFLAPKVGISFWILIALQQSIIYNRLCGFDNYIKD